MTLWRHITRPPWRTLVLLLAVLIAPTFVYMLWSPGTHIHDGRHDLRTNGIWIQHGWLDDDSWFQRNGADKSHFRDDNRIKQLADRLTSHGVKYVFPHLCHCDPGGSIPAVDPVQAERFLDHFEHFSVIPWIGGVLDVHCLPGSEQWRQTFVSSAVGLLQKHPRIAGV